MGFKARQNHIEKAVERWAAKFTTNQAERRALKELVSAALCGAAPEDLVATARRFRIAVRGED